MTLIFAIFILASVVMWIALFRFIQRIAHSKSLIAEPTLLNGTKLVLQLSPSALQKLTSLSKESKNSYVAIAAKGIALFELAFESKKHNNKLAIVDVHGNVIKEISEL